MSACPKLLFGRFIIDDDRRQHLDAGEFLQRLIHESLEELDLQFYSKSSFTTHFLALFFFPSLTSLSIDHVVSDTSNTFASHF